MGIRSRIRKPSSIGDCGSFSYRQMGNRRERDLRRRQGRHAQASGADYSGVRVVLEARQDLRTPGERASSLLVVLGSTAVGAGVL